MGALTSRGIELELTREGCNRLTSYRSGWYSERKNWAVLGEREGRKWVERLRSERVKAVGVKVAVRGFGELGGMGSGAEAAIGSSS